MLTAYLTTLIIGGSLLLLSIFGGGDQEMDQLEAGVDGDFDGDLDGDAGPHGLELHGFDAWLPVGSLRFWTFFAAFFGLAGTALTAASNLGMVLILLPSISVGYLSGLVATKVLRALTSQSVGRVVSGDALIGTTGTLLLPVAPGAPGKVRMQLGERTLEQIANSDEESLALGSRVLVIGVHDGGGVVVAPAPLLGSGDSDD